MKTINDLQQLNAMDTFMYVLPYIYFGVTIFILTFLPMWLRIRRLKRGEFEVTAWFAKASQELNETNHNLRSLQEAYRAQQNIYADNNNILETKLYNLKAEKDGYELAIIQYQNQASRTGDEIITLNLKLEEYAKARTTRKPAKAGGKKRGLKGTP